MTTGDASADGPTPARGRVSAVDRAPAEAPVTIRVARQADAGALSRLGGLSTSTQRALARDLDRTAGPHAEVVVLVAEVGPSHLGAGPAPHGVEPVDATIVGAALGQVLVDEGHVLDLAVAPAHRGAGVGRTLLAALLQQLTERGATAHTLEVRPTNLAAIGLYRAAGFAVEGRRPRYYPDGEDALLLWRRDADDRA